MTRNLRIKICDTVTLPDALCHCEACFISLRKEHVWERSVVGNVYIEVVRRVRRQMIRKFVLCTLHQISLV